MQIPASSASGVSGEPRVAGRGSSTIVWQAALALLLALAAISAVWAASPQARPGAGHVGSAACAECHDAAWKAWSSSQHHKAMQPASAATVLGDFRNARFSLGGVTSTFFVRDGRHMVRTDGPDGRLADFEIRYTFGLAPLQQYLIEMPGGRLQALGIAWDSRPKAQGGQRWFHLYREQAPKAGDPLHWTGIDQTWNHMCAECHATDLRKGYDAAAGEYRTTWAELGVGCEACHGPGADHVAWARAKAAGKAPAGSGNGLAVALNERAGVTWLPVPQTGNARRSAPRTSSRELDTCGRCHARATRLTDRYRHGASLWDSHLPSRLDPGLFWDDGQMRDEVFNWGSFLQSRMHAQGVTCSDCHDPHSQALRRPGNDLCAGCHLPGRFDTPEHTRHAKGTSGASCTACHMPTTTYMVVDPRHDHSMRIPRPDLTATLGVPNACNQCHAKQTPQWAAEAIARWTGRPPGGFLTFAEALYAGAAGAPQARGRLVKVIEDRTQPAIVRASAIDRLARWLTPSTLNVVANSLNDADPAVRVAAVDAIANADPAVRLRFLPRMLQDPVLAVRTQAARGLAGEPEPQLAAADRPAFARVIGEYVAVQMQNADRPESRLNLAGLHAARGELPTALAEARKAVALDPSMAAARVNLADLLRTVGDESGAQAVLREGIAKAPRESALHHALGLSLVRQQRRAEALVSLREAARLAPRDARYAYVYAVALNDGGQPAQAVTVLSEALKHSPYDRDLLFGLAHFSAAAGRRDAARHHARQLTELDPENVEFRRLAAALAR